MSALGKKLRHLRREANLSQDDMARLLGITKSSISNYERGCRIPSALTVYNMAKIFGVPVSEIMDNTKISNKQDIIEYDSDKHPRRTKKLMYAFDALSDKAQLIAIERMEELMCVPTYQVSLEESLTRYVYKKYLETYLPKSSNDLMESYGSYTVDVTELIFHRASNLSAPLWHFKVYSDKDIDDGIIQDIITKNTALSNQSDDNYAIVVDDSNFYDKLCHIGAPIPLLLTGKDRKTIQKECENASQTMQRFIKEMENNES